MSKKEGQIKTIEISVEEKLRALYELQLIDTQIDKIKIVRGELPLEVQDLEDEVAGMETRLHKFEEELKSIESEISNKQQLIKESKALIKKYESQQNSVRNNREYDSLSKEIEFQNLEVQLAEKRIKEHKFAIENKKQQIEEAKELFDGRKKDLKIKKKELDDIIAETEKEEADLLKKSKKQSGLIEERILTAYSRIRSNAKNGLAVVTVERDACGGCFNKIPPQRQLDIKSHKKVIVCEHCGRILVDSAINSEKEKA
ncbi:MAG: hypothetical protein HND27_02240 [Bacteroidetes bacterium]|nr:hypothetical protein [Bacteroidota bacterium]MBV6460932.1 hypothetical protein [Flavobacteriales bacterium]WKZ75671.1 MAG: C4-type zinc ribbon domain-containing protein [Vicingaceae bacterium]MCL4815236.1 hypothetical protein [Flavobacteriales bacterium]NOG94578.1 hypothetical protein [Bacteroidota bacterium]